jgi:hypothetical protein
MIQPTFPEARSEDIQQNVTIPIGSLITISEYYQRVRIITRDVLLAETDAGRADASL